MREIIKRNCLVLGIGNSGRQDDGLGWEFLHLLEQQNLKNVICAYRYQLQIEDAEFLKKFESVIFVDASRENYEKGFEWKLVEPSNQYSFSTHSLKPETILFLSENLYDHKPDSYILGIEGFEWALENKISKKAKKNLQKAFQFILNEVFTHHYIA
jgi:hydrogenase maturation protease